MDIAAFAIPVLYTFIMGNSSSSTTAAAASANDGLPKTASEAVQGTDLSNKVFLVTGAYSGLGVATTKALLSAGAKKVIVAGRNAKLQQEFVNELTVASSSSAKENSTTFPANQVDGSQTIDLADLESVQTFARYIQKTYPTIDCLILNAGIMAVPCASSKQGLEIQMGVNVVGHFLLAKILAKQTKRQVWVSSRGHSMYKSPPPAFDNEKAPKIDIDAIEKVDEATYDTWARYQQSKLGNILLAKQFGVVYPQMEAVAIHPGLVNTSLMRHGNPILLAIFGFIMTLQGKTIQTPDQGARTQTFTAILPSEKLVQGGYYGFCKIEEEAPVAKNMEDAKALFDYCDKFTKQFQS